MSINTSYGVMLFVLNKMYLAFMKSLNLCPLKLTYGGTKMEEYIDYATINVKWLQ